MPLRTTPGGVYDAGGAAGFGAGGYATDLELMDQAKTLIGNKHDEMWGEVKKCMSVLEGMNWHGPARTKFDQLTLHVQQQHDTAMGHLSRMGDGVGSSQQQYQQTETDMQTRFSV